MASPTDDMRVSLEKVHLVLLKSLTKSTKDKILPRFIGDTFEDVERRYIAYSKATEDWDARNVQIRNCCMRLFAATEEPEGHIERLDDCLSETVQCNFIVKPEELDDICNMAVNLLERLPSRPTPLPDVTDGVPQNFFEKSKRVITTEHSSCTDGGWQNLSVVSFISTHTIRTALLCVIYNSAHGSLDAINVLAELLDMASEISARDITVPERCRWLVVRAFLWNSWQKMMMLLNERRLREHVKFGYNHGDIKDYWIRPFSPCPGLSLREITNQNSMKGKAGSMCTWAFELMRSESICLGMDFSLFHARYRALFEGRPARCRIDSPDPCDGMHSDHCARFKGMMPENQSAHDGTCLNTAEETRLVWDRDSYVSIQGARAVDISSTNPKGPLKYRVASERTLAISHVWCHGQGGRPEEGLNSCLHARYVRLAQKLGCDSYWMDTPCIPDQHKLRKEAVAQINDIFANSKVVLVCDRDLMDIDATEMTLQLKESILAAILVCDWNVRAWTFLEAMKGRQNIHFLCKGDVVVSWRSLLEDVSKNGRIDLAILSQLAPQLLPAQSYSSSISTENVGTLLSYRPASRPGDDIVIWSLLTNSEKPIYSALDFWKSQVGKMVLTGFLMSSATRIRQRGFGWAPASPYAAPRSDDAQSTGDFYRAFDGMGTQWAKIEKDGLHGSWWVHAFEVPYAKALPGQDKVMMELNKIGSRFLKTYRFGALLQAISIEGFQHRGDDIGKYRGRTQGILLVVCGLSRQYFCNIGSSKSFMSQPPAAFEWKWMGVWDWPVNVPLPAFEQSNDFVIV